MIKSLSLLLGLEKWNRCYFLHWTHTFWYLSSQEYHRQSVIIHILRLLRCIMVKIWKMHWKLKYSENQYCFANISAMKDRIFMKFYMVGNSCLVSLSFKFYEYSYINTNTWVGNAHTHVLSRVRAFTTCVRLFRHRSS